MLLAAVLAAALTRSSAATPPEQETPLAPHISIKISQIHGLYTFAAASMFFDVEAVKGNPDDPSPLPDPFLKKAFTETPRTDAVGARPALRQLREVLSKKEIAEDLWVASAEAADAEDFYARAAKILPDPKVRSVLEQSLAALGPFYNKRYWDPCRGFLVEKRDILIALAEKRGYSSLFSKAEAFYGAEYDGTMLVVLTPVPSKEEGMRPLVLRDIASLAVPMVPGETENINNLGVIFHEYCHILFHRMDPEALRLLIAAVGREKKKGWVATGGLIEEALATTVGNAWTYFKMDGSEKERPLYKDKAINALAEKLYPAVKSYLEEGRTMDAEFRALVRKAVSQP